ncbi:MAG: translation initiation factor IF-2 N-terminal domain-containing protein [Phycisphaerales bacterium]|nr:translation initiation factor IF-2 N-terminal domain-containing protein [Phycisphaerales bacterium]
MLVNDVPGEETRIAILEDGHLEEIFVERQAAASSVGNVYRGRVTNIEPAIQAAFVDFGHAQRGFLHISDLHPRYFPSGDTKEKVGRKTARRDRPMIQDALRRGDEILVQVLKEGIGTKGPTLTSYISIPGRMMVMMPHMDRVGVTRRVEDEDERREMRKILDTLDLPDNFGFILRTAGMGRSKAELKRDVAYLTRLWKVMERRGETVGTPCELYTESDVLIRTIRDVLRPSIKGILVDSDSAYERCMAFLKVIAPRSAPKVVQYRRALPLFHAYDIERQIELIRSREVPLPSGGRLVIESTEALVAIDVNSGRSRSARDSETNAYQTNMEAADEICRQLRLRDLGGLVINDLIDMRHARHRRDVEDRFTENLKRDRARSTILKISEFGILEMTRQRMRPDLRSSSYVSCPSCRGHGEIMAAEMVAADIVRHVGYLLHHGDISRVEIVVSSTVASVLLSTRRRHLNAIEERLGKNLDVRVSEAIAVDRVDYYAYDQTGSDLDLDSLSSYKPPTVEEIEQDPADVDSEARTGRSRRRRRRRGSAPAADATAIALSGELARELAEIDREEEAEAKKEAKEAQTKKKRGQKKASDKPPAKPVRLYTVAKKLGTTAKEILERFNGLDESQRGDLDLKSHMSMVEAAHADIIASWFGDPEADEATEDDGESKPRRRRRRRGGRGRRGRGGGKSGESTDASESAEPNESAESSESAEKADDGPASKKKRRSRRRRSKSSDEPQVAERTESTESTEAASGDSESAEAKPARKKRRRRRRGSSSGSGEASAETATADQASDSAGESTGSEKKTTSRRRRKKSTTKAESDAGNGKAAASSESDAAVEAKPKPRRRLYGSRRGLKATESTAGMEIRDE